MSMARSISSSSSRAGVRRRTTDAPLPPPSPLLHRRHRRTPPPLLLLLVLALLTASCVPTASGLYHTASETLHWFAHKAAAHPERVRYATMRDAASGVAVPLVTLGVRPLARAAARLPPAPRVLFVFGEHAREVITTEVGLWLGRLLLDDSGGSGGGGSSSKGNSSSIREWPELHAALERAGEKPGPGDWPATLHDWTRALLANLTIEIVPIESVGARRLVEGGELCVRKAAGSGVDLNRNWPFAWRADSPDSEQYGGPAPLSEPQARLLRRVVDAAPPLTAYVNVHSGEWALYTPWDSKPAYAPGLPRDLPALVERVGRICGCVAGPAGAVSGYLAFGSSMDYSYAHAKVPYPLTVEVYGSDGQGKLGAGQANRPLGEFAAENMTAAEAAAVASTARSRGGDNSGAAAGSAAGALAGFAAKLGLWNAGSGRLRRHRDSGGGAGEASAAAAAGRRLHHHQQQQQQRRRLLLQAADALESVGGGGVKLPAPCHHHQQQQQSSQGSVRSRRRLVQELASQPPPAAAAAVADAGADDAILAAYNKGDPSGRACFRMFNPLDSPTYRRVVGDWLAAFVVALRHVARHHHAAAAAGGEGGGG